MQTTASLLLPTLNAAIIDDGIVGGDVPAILRLGSWMAAIALVQVVAAIAAGYLGAVAAMELGRQLRAELFAKVQSMSSQEVGAFGAASLVTRATNDVAQIQNLWSSCSRCWSPRRPSLSAASCWPCTRTSPCPASWSR